MTPTQLSRKKYKQSPKGKAANKKYRQSVNGKFIQTRFNNSEKGKDCNRKYKKSEKGRLADALYLQTPMGKAVALIGAAKQRAIRRNLLFDLDKNFVLKKFIENDYCCEVTGVKFDFKARGEGKKNPRSPSLDQKIPGLGYTEDNTQITTVWFNLMKSDLSTKEALELLEEWRKGK